jgi:hypothetical protein
MFLAGSRPPRGRAGLALTRGNRDRDDTYLAAYNETDEDRRKQLIDQVRTVDARLIDPPLAGFFGDVPSNGSA